MSTMPLARIHAPNEIKLDQVNRPEPGPNDVLIRVHRCGICGSDISYSKLGGLPGAASPFAFGHEFAGEVFALGAEVKGLALGDKVVINPEGADNGIGSNGLKGAFAPYVLFENFNDDRGAVIKLPDSLTYDHAALIEPLAVGMNGVDRGKVKAGDKVVVFGGGPVGLGAALVAKYIGAGSVVVVDLSEKRLAAAEALGLIPFKADSGDVNVFLKQTHGTVTLDKRLGEQAATDVFIEATGVGAVFQQILSTARKNARIVVIGVHFTPVELDMVNFLMRQLTISSSMAYSNDVFKRVIAMLTSGTVDVDPLITDTFPLSQFEQAFDKAKQQNQSVKVLVDCQI